MKNAKRRGLTVLEALIVVVIISLISALLYPSFLEVKRRLQARTTMERMRQFHVSFEVYRNDYGGSNVFDSYRSYYTLGLPINAGIAWADLPGIKYELWRSPCNPGPPDQEICRSALLPGYCGYMSYAAALYQPDLIEWGPWPGSGNGNRRDYLNYIPTYRENIVLVADPYCNPPATDMRAQLTSKRGIALLLSGQVVNKYGTGSAYPITWYSDPPD